MSSYYELVDNRRSHTRWHLGGPLDERGQEIDPWQFREGRPRFRRDLAQSRLLSDSYRADLDIGNANDKGDGSHPERRLCRRAWAPLRRTLAEPVRL